MGCGKPTLWCFELVGLLARGGLGALWCLGLVGWFGDCLGRCVVCCVFGWILVCGAVLVFRVLYWSLTWCRWSGGFCVVVAHCFGFSCLFRSGAGLV